MMPVPAAGSADCATVPGKGQFATPLLAVKLNLIALPTRPHSTSRLSPLPVLKIEKRLPAVGVPRSESTRNRMRNASTENPLPPPASAATVAVRNVPGARTTIAPGGAVTVSVAVPVLPPAAAVIVVVPTATPSATPVELLIVPSAVTDDDHTNVAAIGAPSWSNACAA